MSLKIALNDYLPALLGIQINPSITRRKERPYITFQVVGAAHARHTTGGSGFVSRRVQFDIYADTALEVETLENTLRLSLDTYKGVMGTENLDILGASLENEHDGYINPESADQIGRHRKTVEYVIWHRETVPELNTA